MPYGDSTLSLPDFSKILNIHIRNDMMAITYSSPNMINTFDTSSHHKRFNFRIIKGNYITNQHVVDDFKFFTTLRYEEFDTINYHNIFIEEIKSISELRDGKINEIID
jgi:hypothetical protein